jgi:predicted enzyme related to lactoylglutathione lyase
MSADTLCWADIPVTNLDRAIEFYSAVLGQEVRKMSEGEFGRAVNINNHRAVAAINETADHADW